VGETMILPVKLSDTEIKERGQTLAELLRSIGEKESEKAVTAKEYSNEIKKLEAEVGVVADAIRTGQEDREVEIEKRPDYDRNAIDIVRVDTGEVVATNEMTDSDRQSDLTLN
jgi:hypothetical protein